MKTVSRCAPCLLKIAHTAADAAAAPEPLRMAAVRAALEVLAKDDFSRVPPAIARDLLERVNQVLGTEDPFARIKKEHDIKAAELVERIAPPYLAQAGDPEQRLERAIRLALAGNGMDLATIPDQARPEMAAAWMEAPWAVYHWEEFKHALDKVPDILYLCDNAGEIAFDKVLVKEFLDRGRKVTVAVKGGPALNDALMDDALAVGMDAVEGAGGRPVLITTGQSNMGVDLDSASAEFKRAFREAGMVVAKGQANLECLHDRGREVFFITLIKCSHVAGHYGLDKGSAMLLKSGEEIGED